MPRLSNEECARILGMLEMGCSQTHVARRFNKFSRSTMVRLVRRLNVTGSLRDRPRTGPPRVTSVRQDNFIRQRHLCNSLATAVSTSSTVLGNRGSHIS